MNKGIVARLRRSCSIFRALAIIFLTGFFLPAQSLANSIPAAFQYPVVEVKAMAAGKSPQTLDLSGAKNEYVFLHCRFPGADPGSFKIKLLETSRRPQPTKVSTAFYQLCSAPSAPWGNCHRMPAFDQSGNLLAPFRTWRNTITGQAAEKLTSLFQFNIPQRWSIAHLYQAILNKDSPCQ